MKHLTIILFLFLGITLTAQQGTTSPYSFFGIGTLKFKGTVENRAMGGIGFYADSIHLNLQNPASVSRLRLVNYSLAGSYKYNTLSTANDSENATTTSLDYLAIGIPMGKFGASFGLIPTNSSGYKLQSEGINSLTQYSGSGGLNKAFLSLGYNITPNLSIGVDTNYNFGNIDNTAVTFQEEVQLGTEEVNNSNFRGFSFNFGLLYSKMIAENLELFTAATFTPETDFVSENTRTLSTVLELPNGSLSQVDTREIILANTDFSFPSQYTVGAGLGKPKQWLVGGEFTAIRTSNFNNRTFELTNVKFVDATKLKFGGFYIPNYNSYTSFWKRVVYRGGFRFEETGLNINGEDINEFGISFGLGVPMGRTFSNINLAFELGQRGTQNSGLVKETFFNIFVSLSLNDKWFEKRLYD